MAIPRHIRAHIQRSLAARPSGLSQVEIRDELVAMAALAGISDEESARLLAMARPVARMLRLDEEPVEVGGAKFGGDPALPPSAAWPVAEVSYGRARSRRKQVPMEFILQLPTSLLSESVRTEFGLPDSRMLSLFACCEWHHPDDDLPWIRFGPTLRLDSTDGLVSRACPPKQKRPEYSLEIENDVMLPTYDARFTRGLANDAVDEFCDLIESGWGGGYDQIGGWLRTSLNEDPSTDPECSPLFQLDDSHLALGLADVHNEAYLRVFGKWIDAASSFATRGATSVGEP
jgi:hypothetical protein